MLDVDGLREHIETTLGDTALGTLLDAAYEAIANFAGVGGSEEYAESVTEIITTGPGDLLMLSRPASSIASVIEGDTTLATDDYELVNNQMVKRLQDGTNPQSYWRRRLEVTYAPLSDLNERDRVAIALVKLDLDFTPGVTSERLGDWAISYGNASSGGSYAEQRSAILASLHPGFLAV